MSKHAITAGIAAASMLALGACMLPGENIVTQRDLPPCTVAGTPFEAIPFKSTPTDGSAPEYLWPKEYHRRVTEIVNAHVRRYTEELGGEVGGLQCDRDELLAATAELTSLARGLHPWKDGAVALSEGDLDSVLREYRRTYECSLLEQQKFFPVVPGKTWCCPASTPGNVCVQEHTAACLQGGGTTFDTLDACLGYGCRQPDDRTYNSEMKEQFAFTAIVQKEIPLARASLDRTLNVLAGIEKLRPLALELHCLERVSLELRNILGLLAETASCLPRILDTRGGLRADPAADPASAPAT